VRIYARDRQEGREGGCIPGFDPERSLAGPKSYSVASSCRPVPDLCEGPWCLLCSAPSPSKPVGSAALSITCPRAQFL
jgi:hypothetical protein